MSQENVGVVRRLYTKWQREALPDLDDETIDLLDPEIEWDASRRTFDPGVYHGHDGMREFAGKLREVWESCSIRLAQSRRSG